MKTIDVVMKNMIKGHGRHKTLLNTSIEDGGFDYVNWS